MCKSALSLLLAAAFIICVPAPAAAQVVEPIEGDAENLLVTFLWRDAAAERFVAVFPFARANPLPHLFARMEGTDLWYRSYRLRRDARFEYLISAQDSLTPYAAREPTAARGWLENPRPDPLNPHRNVEPPDEESPGGEAYVSSYVELPGARFATRRARLPLRFYLEAGLLEVNETPSLLHANRHLRDVLEAKGYDVTYSEFNGRHDAICWRGSLSEGLRALLARPSR